MLSQDAAESLAPQAVLQLLQGGENLESDQVNSNV
jgi:hypothetical protein